MWACLIVGRRVCVCLLFDERVCMGESEIIPSFQRIYLSVLDICTYCWFAPIFDVLDADALCACSVLSSHKAL